MSESKEEMINRIVSFRKNGNDLWNFYGGSRPLTKEDYDQYEQAKKDYDMLTRRSVLETMTDEELSILKESGIGGEFGIPSEVENISKEYGIDSNLLMQIYYYFNGMDNFAKEYIDLMKDPEEKQEKSDERFYLKLFDFVDKLNKRRRIIRNFDMDEEDFIYRGKYEKLCRDLKINLNGDYLFVKEEELVKIVETLSEQEQELVLKIYEEKATIQEVADDFDISMKRVKTMRSKVLKKIYDKYTEIINEETITKEAREEFIDKFFENSSIYKTEEPIELESDVVDELNDIYEKGYEGAREAKRLFLADPANILVTDLNLSARALNVFKEYGYNTCKDVIDNFAEIKQIKGFGKKTVDIVLSEIRARGFEIVDEDEVEEVVYEVKEDEEDGFEIECEDDGEEEEDDEPVYIDDKVEALASLAFMQARQSKILSPRNIKVTDLNFNARILGILKKNEIYTLQDVIDKYDEFPNLSNFGAKTIETLVEAVHNQGFKFNFENELVEDSSVEEEKDDYEEIDLDSFDKSIDELDDIEVPEDDEEVEDADDDLDDLDSFDSDDDEDDDEIDYEGDDDEYDFEDDDDEIEDDDDSFDDEDDDIDYDNDEDDVIEEEPVDEESEEAEEEIEEEEDEEEESTAEVDEEAEIPAVEEPKYKGYRLKQAEELLAEIDELEDIEEVKTEKEPETDEEKREKLISLIEKARTVKKNLMDLLSKNKKTDED